MKKFLFNCSIFLLSLVCLSIGLEHVVTNGLKKSKSFYFIDWNRMYNGEINADIIINGNSKAWHHISPKIIDSVIGLNSYNLGIDGYDFMMQKAKFDMYSKYNKTPKIVIQIVGNSTLDKRDDLYQNIQFKPYINDPIIREITKKYKGFSFLDYNLPLVRYLGDSDLLINGLIGFLGYAELQKDINKYKGYEAYDWKWDNSFEEFKKNNPNGKLFNMSEDLMQLFELYLKEQTEQGIKVILVYSPTYYESQKYVKNKQEIINFYKLSTKNKNVLFIDYSNSLITKNKEYYYNSQHLNKKEAELFTSLLVSDLKNLSQ